MCTQPRQPLTAWSSKFDEQGEAPSVSSRSQEKAVLDGFNNEWGSETRQIRAVALASANKPMRHGKMQTSTLVCII